MDKTPYSSLRENNDNKKLSVYDLTYSMNYDGEGYNFSISQRTLRIYSLNPISDFSHFESSIKEQVASLFKGNSRLWVEKRIKVEPNLISDEQSQQQEPVTEEEKNKQANINLRGIENVNYYDKLSQDKQNQLTEKGFTYYDLNAYESVKVSKNANVNKYKLNLWL